MKKFIITDLIVFLILTSLLIMTIAIFIKNRVLLYN